MASTWKIILSELPWNNLFLFHCKLFCYLWLDPSPIFLKESSPQSTVWSYLLFLSTISFPDLHINYMLKIFNILSTGWTTTLSSRNECISTLGYFRAICNSKVNRIEFYFPLVKSLPFILYEFYRSVNLNKIFAVIYLQLKNKVYVLKDKIIQNNIQYSI